MNLAGIQIGYGKEVPNQISLNIYVSGCENNKECDRKLCHNPKLHSFNHGKPYQEWYEEIESILVSDFIECVCLLGGEPFDQSINDLKDLLLYMEDVANKQLPVYAYTGYSKGKLDTIKQYVKELKIKNVYVGEYKENCSQYWLFGMFDD